MTKRFRAEKQPDNAWTFLLDEKSETILLFPFWRDFEGIYQNLLQVSSLSFCNELVLRQMIVTNLKLPLIRMVKKILIHEFHLNQKNNENLTLAEFLEYLAGTIELPAFFARYPILHDVIEKTFIFHNLYLIELLTRLQNDLNELGELFNLGGYEWSSIKCLGDSHCLGKHVSIISFDCPNQKPKYLIYKPRDINLEKAFNSFLDFINNSYLSKRLKTIKTLPKDGYGWVEYVEQRGIQKSNAGEYYFRYGVLLGVCHLLNGRDIHFENIIASGEEPVIIDLECLFAPPVTTQQYENLDFPTIFATLLIPPIQNQAQAKYDFSGIRNQATQQAMIYQYIMKGDFQRIVYLEKKASFIESQKNVLVDELTQNPIPASAYSQVIAEGYHHYMHWVITNREAVLAFVIGTFSHLETRVVFRPTFRYQRLLLESFAPNSLLDVQHYSDSLNELLDKTHPLSTAIDSHELFDLLNGDIPYFSTMTSDTLVKNSQREIIQLKTKCSGLERVVNKINYINAEYINQRIEQILTSLDGIDSVV